MRGKTSTFSLAEIAAQLGLELEPQEGEQCLKVVCAEALKLKLTEEAPKLMSFIQAGFRPLNGEAGLTGDKLVSPAGLNELLHEALELLYGKLPCGFGVFGGVFVHAGDADTVELPAQPEPVTSIGGVHPDLRGLRDLIMRETDVEAIHALQPLPSGRALYVIETPFMTFPKFAVGSTNAANDDVRILATCGALWNAQEQFAEFLQRGGDL